jgi:acyl CoA:acetate/3-ketoacid CoA transferase beta subunit
MAVIRVGPEGLILEEIAPGVSVDEVQAATEATLHVGNSVRVITD